MKGDIYLQLSDTFRSCFGITVSPGNLVAAVVCDATLKIHCLLLNYSALYKSTQILLTCLG